MRLAVCAAAGVIFAVSVGAGATFASPPMVAAAKKAGLPATNCQYCHTDAAPKKDTFKPDALNDRGKFLLADKQQRNLKAVDVEKLKEFDKK